MNVYEVENAILETLAQGAWEANDAVFKEYSKFLQDRDGYTEKIISLFYGHLPENGEIIDLNDLLWEFSAATNVTSFGILGQEKDLVGEDEIYEYGELLEEQKEAIKKFLAQDRYKGVTLEQIATLMRVKEAQLRNDEIEDASRRYARNREGDSEKSYERLYEEALYGYGYKFNNDELIEDVISEENVQKEANLSYTVGSRFNASEIMIERIAARLGVDVERIGLDKSEISLIQRDLDLYSGNSSLVRYHDYIKRKKRSKT